MKITYPPHLKFATACLAITFSLLLAGCDAEADNKPAYPDPSGKLVYNDLAQPLKDYLDADTRAVYSAIGVAAFRAIYGVDALLADTIPVVFSHPVLPASVSPDAFRVTLNDGSMVIPLTASFIPNLEYNESARPWCCPVIGATASCPASPTHNIRCGWISSTPQLP